MNKLISILTAGMLAIPTAFSINNPINNDNEPSVSILYEPENDDPTAEFPLIVVDSPEAYTAFCTASENNDEPFFVAMPANNVDTDVFLSNLTRQIEYSTINPERIYLVASKADSPLLDNTSGIFTYTIVLNPTIVITEDILNDILSHIKS